MKITFLGTGADDWDWKNPGPGTPESTCTLLGETCLVDAGPGALRALAAAGADPARIRDLVLTHSHSDHLQPDCVGAIAAAGKRRLRAWGPPQAMELLDPELCDLRPLLPGDVFRVAGMRAVALPANHLVGMRLEEQPLHYAFDDRASRLLYALDGAWLLAKARLALARFLGGRPLTAVVWDSTCGNTFRDWRFAEHNDLKMIDAMRGSMLKAGLASPGTIHVFDHVARTLWPKTAAARRRLAARFGGVLAEDGMVLDAT